MTGKDKSAQEGEFTLGSLDDFKERFGDVSDRFEQAVHPYLDRKEMPSAEHPQMIEERLQAEAGDSQGDGYEFLLGREVKPEFDKAAQNLTDQEVGAGKGSPMVQEDAAELNMTPPPEMAKDQDRAVHYERMSEDDQFAREGGIEMSERYYADLEARMEDYALEQEAMGQEQSQTQDQDQGQDYTP